MSKKCVFLKKKSSRAALTLIEVMVVLVILSTLMVMVLMSMTKTLEYSVLSEIQDDLAYEATTIFNTVGEDLSRSSWYFPAELQSDLGDNPTRDPRTRPGDFQTGDPAIDRQMRYYPMVQKQLSVRGLNSTIPWTHRSVDHVFLDLPKTFSGEEVTLSDADLSVFLGNNEEAKKVDDDYVGLGDFAKYFGEGKVKNAFANLESAVGGIDENGNIIAPQSDEQIQALIATLQTELKSARRQFMNSFYAPSVELVFVRASNSDWTAVPSDAESEQRLFFPGESSLWSPEIENFTKDPHDWLNLTEKDRTTVATVYGKHDDIGVLGMDDWNVEIVNNVRQDYITRPDVAADADPRLKKVPVLDIAGAWLHWSAGEVAILPRWETMVEYPEVFTETSQISLSDIREYQYAVVPSPFGVGRLVRAYSAINGTDEEKGQYNSTDLNYGVNPGQWISREAGPNEIDELQRVMVVDKVLSDNVARVVFETYRTNNDLGLNEVRLTLYMAGYSQTKKNVQNMQRYSMTMQMQSSTDPLSNQEKIDAFVGETVKIPMPILY